MPDDHICHSENHICHSNETTVGHSNETIIDLDLSAYCCPLCHSDLKGHGDGLKCTGCGAEYSVHNGVPNMVVAAGFSDEDHEERWACEECTGSHLVNHYLVPLLDDLFPGRPRGDIRVLSIGCGVGIDTVQLNEAGYDCRGIDAGNRTKMWSQRGRPGRFAMAAVQRMPFREGQFDFAFMNCVLPHVGVVGDSQELTKDWQQQRQSAVDDTIRIVKPGGYILMANPNRLCPLDLFHRPDETTHIPRFHSPSERFLQSYTDHKSYFVDEGQCQSIKTLPFANFWGFHKHSKSSRYIIGRLLQSSIRAYFKLLSSKPLSFLRKTALNPWLVVLIRR